MKNAPIYFFLQIYWLFESKCKATMCECLSLFIPSQHQILEFRQPATDVLIIGVAAEILEHTTYLG